MVINGSSLSPFVAVVRTDSPCHYYGDAVDIVVFVVDVNVEVVVITRRCLGSLIFGLFLSAEVKALMAYDEDTEENASESNDDQGQAAVVAAKKSD